jgi:SPP1 gp7 family putative phage head morphogenesis protein
LAKSINKTTIDALRKILSDGFAQGDSIQTLTGKLEGFFKESEKWRAEQIARTEVQTAANFGAVERYKSEGITEFEWLASPNSCEECLPLDGKRFPIDSGEQPPLHNNCTCGILAVIPE